jgi:hypothetical protein
MEELGHPASMMAPYRREPRRLAPGQAWHKPQEPAHHFKNGGGGPARLINILIVEKGKPRTETFAQ